MCSSFKGAIKSSQLLLGKNWMVPGTLFFAVMALSKNVVMKDISDIQLAEREILYQ